MSNDNYSNSGYYKRRPKKEFNTDTTLPSDNRSKSINILRKLFLGLYPEEGKPDYMKAPLIAFAVLLLLLGLWLLYRDTTGKIPENPNRQVVTVEESNFTDLLEPFTLEYDKSLINVSIPKNYKGEPVIGPAVLVDATDKKIIWYNNHSQVGQIASMTKMFLMLATYGLADSGVISLQDTVEVIRAAQLMGGSQAYLDIHQRYTVESLLRAVAVQSANDAAYLLAWYIGDSSVVEGVNIMNKYVEELGLKNTKLYNAHGLPPSSRVHGTIQDGIGWQNYKGEKLIVATKANVSTPIEMAKLGIVMSQVNKIKQWTSISYDSLWDVDRNRHDGAWKMRNHFSLVGKDFDNGMVVDGIKTGYTYLAGFCVTASATLNDRELVAVVFGARRQEKRDEFVQLLFEKAYHKYFPPTDSTVITSK